MQDIPEDKDKTVEEPAEQPVEMTTDQPVDIPAEESLDEPADMPEETVEHIEHSEPAEQPVDGSATEPAEQSEVVQDESESAAEPAEQPTEEPAEQPVEPVAEPAVEPTPPQHETPAEEVVEHVETPVAATVEEPVEHVETPVPEEKPAEPAAASAAESAPQSAKKKILLVEDDVALAAVYRSRLELEDFEIYEVNNGEQALQAAKEFKPDLILLDAMMPKISGFDVLDILRHTPDTANIRVIMLTALSQPKDKERAESLGVDDYLVKSQVVIGDVVERVRHHLGMTK